MLEGSCWGCVIAGDDVFYVISFIYGVTVGRTDGMGWHCFFRCMVNKRDQSYSFVVYVAVEKQAS